MVVLLNEVEVPAQQAQDNEADDGDGETHCEACFLTKTTPTSIMDRFVARYTIRFNAVVLACFQRSVEWVTSVSDNVHRGKGEHRGVVVESNLQKVMRRNVSIQG